MTTKHKKYCFINNKIQMIFQIENQGFDECKHARYGSNF